MTDPDAVPVEEHEPIDHVENDVIVASVVNAPPEPRRHSPFEDPHVLWAAVIALACFSAIAALTTATSYRTADREAALAAQVTSLTDDLTSQRQTEECWARLDAAADVARVAFEVGMAQQHDAAWQAVLAYSRGDTAAAQAHAAEAEALDAQLAALEAEVRAAVDAYRQGAEVCAVADATTTATTTAPP